MTRSMNPLKAFVYCAAGVPVVSTADREPRRARPTSSRSPTGATSSSPPSRPSWPPAGASASRPRPRGSSAATPGRSASTTSSASWTAPEPTWRGWPDGDRSRHGALGRRWRACSDPRGRPDRSPCAGGAPRGRCRSCSARSASALPASGSRGRTDVWRAMSRACARSWPSSSTSSCGVRRAAARATVAAHVPEGATVIVVSRGDQELVELPARTGWHFPQTDGNIWAGYHPETSADAVRELEELHARGADYFLLPGTSAWWLEHYEGLREHLDGYLRVTEPHEGCVLFDARARRPARRERRSERTRPWLSDASGVASPCWRWRRPRRSRPAAASVAAVPTRSRRSRRCRSRCRSRSGATDGPSSRTRCGPTARPSTPSGSRARAPRPSDDGSCPAGAGRPTTSVGSAGNPLALPTEPDEHNVYVVAVDGRGVVHVAGNMHNVPVRWVRSRRPGSITQWTAEGRPRRRLGDLSAVRAGPGGRLLFFYRSGASGEGDLMLRRWDPAARAWSRPTTVIDGRSAGESAYPQRIAVDRDGTLHLMYTWRATPMPRPRATSATRARPTTDAAGRRARAPRCRCRSPVARRRWCSTPRRPAAG